MKLGAKRIRQLVIGILAVSAMSVSTVAACACSHHEEAPKEERSCHPKPKQSHHTSHTAPKGRSAGESCDCSRFAVRASVKAEGFKLKKHTSPFVKGFDLGEAQYTLAAQLTGRAAIRLYVTSMYLTSASSRGPPHS